MSIYSRLFRSSLLGLAALCALPLARSQGDTSSSPRPTRIEIDATRELGPVNRLLFGQLIVGADSFQVYQESGPERFAINRGHGVWDPRRRAPDERKLPLLQAYRPGVLRYPDGLGVHNHDWKRTIGPVADRPDFQFGLDEFLALAAEVGARPMIVVSEYVGQPDPVQSAADLVEYLNKPATPEFPWAMKRAAHGREEPWDVRLFELGNESWIDHRLGVPNAVRSAADVGRHATAMARAMKAVDPRIRTAIPYHTREEFWNADVLAHIGPEIDAAVIHTYPVMYGGPMLEGPIEAEFLQALLLAGQQGFIDIQDHRAAIRRLAGRDLPIWLTEYNAGLVQRNTPRSYRFSLGAALMSADLLGRSLDPTSGVQTAAYWQWLNGFFGAVRTVEFPENERHTRAPHLRAAHHMFTLWGQRFADRLLPVQTDGPVVATGGFSSILPAQGPARQPAGRIAEINLLTRHGALNPVAIPGVDGQPIGPDAYSFRLEGMTGQESYPTFAQISFRDLDPALVPPAPGLAYELSFEVRWVPEPDSSAVYLGVQIGDNRGWNASGSAAYVASLQDATDWKPISFRYQPRTDTPGVQLLARLKGGSTPARGTFELRKLRIEPHRAEVLPAPRAVSAFASRDADGRWIDVMLLNLSNSSAQTVHLSLRGAAPAGAAEIHRLEGESAASVGDPFGGLTLRSDETLPPAAPGAPRFSLTLAPHSMTAVRVPLR